MDYLYKSISYLINQSGMRFFIFCIPILMLLACKQQIRYCRSETPDERLNAYNDILNELIETRFYNFYLGTEAEKLLLRYSGENSDTAAEKREILKQRNRLFGDSSRFGVLYLDTALRPYFSPVSVYLSAGNPSSRPFLQALLSFSNQPQSVIDSLNQLQQTYTAADFKSCFAMVRSIREIDTMRFSIGKVRLSAICFNKQHTRGILYYEFRCGWLCAKGEALVIERKAGRWQIVNSYEKWFS